MFSLLGLGSTQLALDLSLLALESKLLALGLFAREALILTQVNPNPMQVQWNLAQVDLKMVFNMFYDSPKGHKWTKDVNVG